MKEIVAVIPARSGSKSVRDKNIIPLSGFPVISYSIAAARLSKYISRVILESVETMGRPDIFVGKNMLSQESQKM